VKRDYAAAAALYCRAAAAGQPDAAYHLGLMRLYGRGVEADDSYAKSWLQRAAATGQKHAVLLLERLPGAARRDADICLRRTTRLAGTRLPAPPKAIAEAVAASRRATVSTRRWCWR